MLFIVDLNLFRLHLFHNNGIKVIKIIMCLFGLLNLHHVFKYLADEKKDDGSGPIFLDSQKSGAVITSSDDEDTDIIPSSNPTNVVSHLHEELGSLSIAEKFNKSSPNVPQSTASAISPANQAVVS